ncbi:MAG TPA: phospho-sugar mutase, partial [Chitinophagaceae bacterium]|nr:phospho-sugar mutase [Chitinophagaceae bacterium]
MMENFRSKTPQQINGSAVVTLLDYKTRKGRNMKTGEEWTINLPASNVLQFILEDGTKISARPSGTEPKIKFYFSVNDQLSSVEAFEDTKNKLDSRIKGVIEDMGLK